MLPIQYHTSTRTRNHLPQGHICNMKMKKIPPKAIRSVAFTSGLPYALILSTPNKQPANEQNKLNKLAHGPQLDFQELAIDLKPDNAL